MEVTTTMTAAATPIQGKEGTHGDGEKGIACSSKTMELKGGADDVTEVDSLDPKSLAGHKRKASLQIDPRCINSPDPVPCPTVQHHAEMVPQGINKNHSICVSYMNFLIQYHFVIVGFLINANNSEPFRMLVNLLLNFVRGY